MALGAEWSEAEMHGQHIRAGSGIAHALRIDEAFALDPFLMAGACENPTVMPKARASFATSRPILP